MRTSIVILLLLLLPAGAGAEVVLRSQEDTARNHVWVLTPEGVTLYDSATKQRKARIELPDWHWVDEAFSCAPDLAIGPNGEAVVSSNVVPTLWRIDAATLAVTRHALRLDAHAERDVGFTGLVYAREQHAFFAVGESHGLLWRIDPLLRRAQHIPLSAPVYGACGLAVRPGRLVRLCVRRGRGEWQIVLAPDQRSGHVRTSPCVR